MIKTNNLLTDKPVVLASKSPRRAELLKLLNIDFIAHPSNYHEPDDENSTPEKLVQTHAYHKAKDVADKFENAWIIGADTIVVLENNILEKPVDRHEAVNMLKFLSDRTHFVYTGYCLLNSQNNKFFTGVQGTAVTFQKLSLPMINYYIDHYQPFDKAGSYGIQDYSAIFVKNINGCFYNVVGFPLAKFYHQTRKKLGSLL